MKHIIVAIVWAVVLIGLPVFAKFGLISVATAEGMAPTLTVLAALHIGVFGARTRCGAKGQRA